ncbi:MAG: MerR family transcriptional regulator [Anaerolineae bacterium]|nr:MerR family transcriptional regulator [Anaerolineae bacterium]
MRTFTIGEIARHADVETSTIRYYERIGLLPRPDRVNGRRVYSDSVLKRMTLIKATQAAGFTLAEILKLMELWEAEGRSPSNWRTFVERKLEETEVVIREAERTKTLLTSALACECWDSYTMSLDTFIETVRH